MRQEDVLRDARQLASALLAGNADGHDLFHTLRVARTACAIAGKEGADPFVTELAALLHDVDDAKLFPQTSADLGNARSFLEGQELPQPTVSLVLEAIRSVSFRGTDSVIPDTPEGRCVQDADRLDAIGAIGIARCFAFGGSRGRAIYDPDEPPLTGMDEAQYRGRASHSVNHFYEKLLLLKDLMTTQEGKRLAEARHRFLEAYLREFLDEWEGKA